MPEQKGSPVKGAPRSTLGQKPPRVFAQQTSPPFAQGGLEIFWGNPSDRTPSPSLLGEIFYFS